MLGFAALSAAAWLAVGLWAALLVAGVALLLVANLEMGGRKTRRARSGSSGRSRTSGRPAADLPLTNGAVDGERG
jgi:hypothetical protein